VLEIAATKFILPLGGLFIILFIGWFHNTKKTKEELSNQGSIKIWYYSIYLFLVRFVAPIAIIAVFVYGGN
jgi:NSS family neurotransmitter:Na+ symporter